MDYLTFTLLTLVFLAACYFLNRYMDEQQIERELQRLEKDINKETTSVVPSAAFDEQFKKFDERLNNTWDHISGVKQSLESLKLQIGLKGKN